MSDGFSDENIAMLDSQVREMLSDASGLSEVISRASEARMLGLAEAAVYQAVHGDFVSSPSTAGRKFFTDEDHNDWRDTDRPRRITRLATLATIELQHVIKTLGCGAHPPTREQEASDSDHDSSS